MKIPSKTAFTLLEVIIVIIIVGVLASLALPRFFKVIQYSYSTEAFSSMQAVRGALERCYLLRGGDYSGCNFASIDVPAPELAPNAHFEYAIQNTSTTGYTIHAVRKTREGGATANTIDLTVTSGSITKSGTTIFLNIQ